MRFRIIIAFCFSLSISHLFAQDSISNINRSGIDYYFLYSQYMNMFSETPSLLTEWRYNNWSYIGADYETGKGNFRNPQKYNKLSQINIRTESVYRPLNGKWIFHGKFRYSNGMADSVNANLSYNIEKNGSPFYLFQLKPGNWNLQNYEFNVTAANRISKKLSLGFKVLYDGDLSFRLTDTRNEQYSLNTKLVLSADYHLSEKNTISLGLDYGRVKTEPLLKDQYHHESTDLTYNRYLNTGLGSYIKNLDFRMTINKETKGLLMQWFRRFEKSSYTAIYEFFTGEETYLNKNLTNINDQNIILKYKYFSNKARISSLHTFANRFLGTCLNFELLKGYGNQWSESSKTYLNNYNIDIMDVDYKATLYNPSSFLRRVNLVVNLHNETKFDKNYGYQFNFTNLITGVNAELMFRTKYFRTGFMGGLSWGKNMDNLNLPNAASTNIFVNWVANPLLSYLACDYLEIPAYLRFDIPVKNNLIEVLFRASHQYPTNLNYNQDSFFDTDDNFRIYNLSLKFYF